MRSHSGQRRLDFGPAGYSPCVQQQSSDRGEREVIENSSGQWFCYLRV